MQKRFPKTSRSNKNKCVAQDCLVRGENDRTLMDRVISGDKSWSFNMIREKRGKTNGGYLLDRKSQGKQEQANQDNDYLFL